MLIRFVGGAYLTADSPDFTQDYANLVAQFGNPIAVEVDNVSFLAVNREEVRKAVEMIEEITVDCHNAYGLDKSLDNLKVLLSLQPPDTRQKKIHALADFVHGLLHN